MKKNDKKNTKNPYKTKKFEAFIELIKGNVTCHWVQIADALGVDKTTITRWKKLPLAQKAIRDGIERALEGMEKAGSKDWKMWESKLKMLGVSPIERSESDVTSGGKPIPIIDIKDVLSDNSNKEAGETKEKN